MNNKMKKFIVITSLTIVFMLFMFGFVKFLNYDHNRWNECIDYGTIKQINTDYLKSRNICVRIDNKIVTIIPEKTWKK